MQGIIKALQLGDMLKSFRLPPISEADFAKFYYDGTMASRTGDRCVSPLEDLFEECTTPLAKNAHLLMGHRGSGKSTELFNLKKRFEQAGQPTCIIDFMADTDFQNSSHWDFMLLITEGLCKIANECSLDIPKGTLDNIFNYLKRDEIRTIDTSKSSDIGMSFGTEARTPALINLLNFFASIKKEIKANTSSRTIITEKMEKRASEWIGFINEISNNMANMLSGKQPILIFENYDKLQSPEKALNCFRYPFLSEMPFPIIYTFPISLYYDPRFAWVRNSFSTHILPMIKVSNLDKSENTEGINTIYEIIKLRSDINLFEDDALKLLIKRTGGVLRDLFECIISAARRANRRSSGRIEMEDSRSALSGLGDELTRKITIADNIKLFNIYNDPAHREQIEDLQFFLNMMQGLVILEYKNGERWHDLHPMVTEFLKKQGVINDS